MRINVAATVLMRVMNKVSRQIPPEQTGQLEQGIQSQANRTIGKRREAKKTK